MLTLLGMSIGVVCCEALGDSVGLGMEELAQYTIFTMANLVKLTWGRRVIIGGEGCFKGHEGSNRRGW